MTSPIDSTAFSVADAAKRLGITPPTVYKLLRDGQLRAFKIGRRTLISGTALMEFIRCQEAASVSHFRTAA